MNLVDRVFATVLRTVPADATLRRLAALLDVPPEALLTLRSDPRLSYRPFTIRKRGGRRQIAAPSGELKRLQRCLLRRYLDQQSIHHAATAFRAGGSIAAHARTHLGQAIVLTVDLADFFPTTRAWRVRRWFVEQGWSGEALAILLRLCVYHGGLPQGAPTSPSLSNLVNVPLDESLHELAATHGARYSRYSDDVAFSWSIEAEPLGFRRQVEDRLASCGYHIQPRKGWRLQHSKDHPQVTGLILAGHRLRWPERIARHLRALRWRWFVRDPIERQRIAGYRGLRKLIQPRKFLPGQKGRWPDES